MKGFGCLLWLMEMSGAWSFLRYCNVVNLCQPYISYSIIATKIVEIDVFIWLKFWKNENLLHNII